MRYHVRTLGPFHIGVRQTYSDMVFRDRDSAESHLARLATIRPEDGKRSLVVEVRETVWQYSANGQVITGDFHRDADADQVTAFLADGTVACSVTRTTRKRWRIESSDYAQYSATLWRTRYATAKEALRAGLDRVGFFWTEVDDWDA